MNRTIYWKTLMMDSVPVSDQLTYSFFEETGEHEDSVTCMTEDNALRWLFANPIFRDDFIREFLPDPTLVRYYFGLRHPFTRPNVLPGDIDLLLAHPDYPARAITFECKRVKIVAQEQGDPTVNRLNQLNRGIKQANAYQSLGFHQSYLLIILLDDGRSMKTSNVMFRYAETAPVAEVFNIPWATDLHPDVGIVYVRINQMTGKHINHSYSLGYSIDKKAIPLEQTAEMTNKIRSLL